MEAGTYARILDFEPLEETSLPARLRKGVRELACATHLGSIGEVSAWCKSSAMASASASHSVPIRFPGSQERLAKDLPNLSVSDSSIKSATRAKALLGCAKLPMSDFHLGQRVEYYSRDAFPIDSIIYYIILYYITLHDTVLYCLICFILCDIVLLHDIR